MFSINFHVAMLQKVTLLYYVTIFHRIRILHFEVELFEYTMYWLLRLIFSFTA